LSEMLSPKDEEENSIINILSQPIWLNFSIISYLHHIFSI
jgi:hypothetical protein